MPTSQYICTYTSHGCTTEKHTINERGVLLQWKRAGVQEYRDHHTCDKRLKYMASPLSPGAASTTNQSTKCSESSTRLRTPQTMTYQFRLVTTKCTLVLHKHCPQDSSIRTISGCQWPGNSLSGHPAQYFCTCQFYCSDCYTMMALELWGRKWQS